MIRVDGCTCGPSMEEHDEGCEVARFGSPSCTHPDSWFDRTICGRDGWMHTTCTTCGKRLDGECGAGDKAEAPE